MQDSADDLSSARRLLERAICSVIAGLMVMHHVGSAALFTALQDRFTSRNPQSNLKPKFKSLLRTGTGCSSAERRNSG